MTTVVSFIVVLGVLIFVHELGHFLMAKVAGVRVLTFSLGFGPRIVGFRKGDTEYVVSALPLGGYVKMAGDEDEAMGEQVVVEEDQEYGPGDYMHASVPRRFGIITAGPAMNIILAFVIYVGAFLISGITLIRTTEVGVVEPDGLAGELGIRSGDRIVAVDGVEVSDWQSAFDRVRRGIGVMHTVEAERDGERMSYQLPSLLAEDGGVTPGLADSAGNLIPLAETYGVWMPYGTMIGSVIDTGVAAAAGIQAGDAIVRLGERPVERWWQLSEEIRAHAGIPVEVAFVRDGVESVVTMIPERHVDESGEVTGRLGIYNDPYDLPLERIRPGLARAISLGGRETWDQSTLVINILSGLISGKISMRKSLGGPVMIARAAGESARGGLYSLLMFIAFLSVNLGMLNLLPIPVLDGGHIVFLGAEALRGRPLSLRVRLVATQVGMAFLILMMIYVTYNDVVRWFF